MLLLAKYLINICISRRYFSLNLTRMAIEMLKQEQLKKDNGKSDGVEFLNENG